MQCLRRRSNPLAKGLSRRPGCLHTNGWPNVSTESGIQAECRSTGVSPPFITEDARGGPEDSSLLDHVEVPEVPAAGRRCVSASTAWTCLNEV